VHASAAKVIINIQTDVSGIEIEGEQFTKFVVNEDATKLKEEYFIGNIETKLNQQIEVIHRVQRETLQVWNEAENMLGWLYILFRKKFT